MLTFIQLRMTRGDIRFVLRTRLTLSQARLSPKANLLVLFLPLLLLLYVLIFFL